MRSIAIVLALLLSACNPVWLPLQPEIQAYPARNSVTGTLENIEKGSIAHLVIANLKSAGYVELRWYKEDQLFEEKSVWLEGPTKLDQTLTRFDDGYYRLVVMLDRSPLLQLDTGTPFIPPIPVEE